MSTANQTEKWEDEVRGLLGVDKRTDRSLLGKQNFSDCKNLVLERGVAKTRPGSIAWGALSFSAVAGTIHGKLHTVEVGTDTWCLLHVGTKLYYGKKTDATPTAIQDLSAADVAVFDQDSSFEDWGFYYGTTGQAVVRILFKQKPSIAHPTAGCLALELQESTGIFVAMAAGIDSGTTLLTSYILPSSLPDQTLGTYRYRVTPIRLIDGIRIASGAPTGAVYSEYAASGSVQTRPFSTFEIGIATSYCQVQIENSGTIDPQITHYLLEITKELDFTDSEVVSSNGNDPDLFYEDIIEAIAATTIMDVDVSNTDRSSTVAPNIWGYRPIPGHLISKFTAGILWFGGASAFPSRLYRSATTGFSWHYGLYDPTAFHAVEESDNKQIQAIMVVSDHLVIWKQNKTAILPGRDPAAAITWRDRKIGVLWRTCAESVSEDEVVCLCHDGMVRLFNGVSYSSKSDVEGVQSDISDKVRPITDVIDPTTVSFVWHRERLALLYGATAARKALVLHPKEGMEWMPWEDLEHEWNASIENDNVWIYLSTITRTFYEQSPLLTETYLDRGTEIVEYGATPVCVQGKIRKNKVALDQLLIEGYFQYVMDCFITVDGGRVVTATVRGTPDPEERENEHQNWYKFAPDEAVNGNFYALTLSGTGKCILRAFFHRVIERNMLSPGWTSSTNYRPYFFLPAWASRALMHLRFDVDSDTAKDYSGNDRDYEFSGGIGGRVFDADMDPGGGQTITGATGSGYACDSWNGFDGIFDEDGALIQSTTFESVCGFTSLAAEVTIMDGGDGVQYWRLLANEDGSLEFIISTDSLSYSFTTAAGVVLASGEQYTIQFVLSNGGLNGQFYASLSDEDFAELLTTRGSL